MEEPSEYDTDGFPTISPYRYNELVEICPIDFETKPEVIELLGKRGIVTGFSFNEGAWAYSVAVQSGRNWYFQAIELKSLDLIFTDDELYGPPDKTEWARIRVDAVTNEATCIAGDPSFISRGPTPLLINLEELIAKQ